MPKTPDRKIQPSSQKGQTGIKGKKGLTARRVVLSLGGEKDMDALPILWKGRDYDREGLETPLADLRKLKGIFELRHVGDRLPVPKEKVRSLFKNKAAAWAECFHPVNLGTERNTIFIDLNLFMKIWDKKMKNLGIHVETQDEASTRRAKTAKVATPARKTKAARPTQKEK